MYITIYCDNKLERGVVMVRMMYRKARKGVSEQYGINISKKIIEKMEITDTDREVEVTYDEKEKVIKIRKR